MITVSRMSFSISIRLLICMLVFLQSWCRGLKQPCNASRPDSRSQWNNEFVCKGINHNLSFSFEFFLYELIATIILFI